MKISIILVLGLTFIFASGYEVTVVDVDNADDEAELSEDDEFALNDIPLEEFADFEEYRENKDQLDDERIISDAKPWGRRRRRRRWIRRAVRIIRHPVVRIAHKTCCALGKCPSWNGRFGKKDERSDEM